MAFSTWNHNYSVGVRSLDEQHIGLFETLNELHDAASNGEALNRTAPLLRKLVNHTQDHFVAEETMMAAVKYPGLAAHREQHRALSEEVQKFVSRFESGENTLSLFQLNSLRDWLAIHIMNEDFEYSPWLAEHGVH